MNAQTFPELSRLAIRLHHTVANLVASERSFSQMNLQHSKLRNRLDAERVNKLVYISINSRTLDVTADKEGLLEEEELEELLLAAEAEKLERHLVEQALHRGESVGGVLNPNLGDDRLAEDEDENED
jgi:hypothetical protein